MKYIIHVNRQYIAINSKLDKPALPCYIVREGNKKPVYAYKVDILGKATMIDSRRHKPLKCGARAWLETDGPLNIKNPLSYKETQKILDNLKLND